MLKVSADSFRPPQLRYKVKLKVGTQCSGWYSVRLVQHAQLVQRPGAAVGAARAPPLNNDRGAH